MVTQPFYTPLNPDAHELQDFIRHVFEYFKSRSQSSERSSTRAALKPIVTRAPTGGDIVPIWSSSGQIIGYQQAAANYPSALGPLARPALNHHIAQAHSTVENRPFEILPNQSPTAEDFPIDLKTRSPTTDWDGWPDGKITRLFSWEEYVLTGGLRSQWAHKGGTSKKGYRNAATHDEGRRTKRLCRGVFSCSNDDCSNLIRPHVEKKYIDEQKKIPGRLPLPTLWHPQPSTSPHQKCPSMGEVSLRRAGPRPPRSHPGSAMNAYYNGDRVATERNKVLRQFKQPRGGDDFLQQLQQFNTKYPDFILHNSFTTLPKTVIVMQTPWMKEQSVRDTPLDGPVNGIVTDGAHGFWQSRVAVLQVSSVYSTSLDRWIPVMMSYIDGHGAQEFKVHFLSLFRGIAEIVELREGEELDIHLATVMDFSQAQREGFILAYIELYSTRPSDDRDDNEL
ncbi:hypothetical protein AGABI1DRAFT_128247 [Agaricus bisporus var. burnettii JB137-S8]|uniref:Uncharacterized protein n=1 Tax=Agaricus bisporus var. burnettii (strain JB137-S8 / ATCC MYA-4627 / FGSC 10392) TaxID=597362 RepID=K5X812_AGABU|nr:uncharacterized protein AGABI1DRAFT_128247 [Agaricus bisporus var. burnettii JB137-S8]EKM79082.1 hypothetical protein AGABI1DRAFT_128247 [Agaricus bisporus var. burnettii JB137-S8]